MNASIYTTMNAFVASFPGTHELSFIEALRGLASSNYWCVLWLEIFLVLLAVGLLTLEVMGSPTLVKRIPVLAIAGQLVLLVIAMSQLLKCPASSEAWLFNGMLVQDATTMLMRVFFLFGGMLVCYLGVVYFDRQRLPRSEFYAITLLVTAGLMVLVESQHFILFFVALELVTTGFYVLVAYCRTRVASLEAGVKYLVLGALSSSLLLFGVALLYGAGGDPSLPMSAKDPMQFAQLTAFLSANASHPMAIAGVVLVLAGLAFKMGAVPFQIWIPDVYQGAPTPTTAFLAVCSKAAGFVVFIRLLEGPFAAMASWLVPWLSVIAAATILFGNVAALSQRNVKRLMGCSGVAHAGYLLAGAAALLSGVAWAREAMLFYLFTYLMGSFAVFAVMAHVASTKDEVQVFEDYEGLARRRPFLGLVLVLGLGSLAGVPPLVGFVGKFVLLMSLFEAGLYGLLVMVLLGVVISIYYYFAWVRSAVFHVQTGVQEPEVLGLDVVHKLTLGLLVLAMLFFGFYQGPLGQWFVF